MIKMEMEITSYQVRAGDARAYDVSPVDAEGMSYPPIADFDDHDDALAFCAMKNSQITATETRDWRPKYQIWVLSTKDDPPIATLWYQGDDERDALIAKVHATRRWPLMEIHVIEGGPAVMLPGLTESPTIQYVVD